MRFFKTKFVNVSLAWLLFSQGVSAALVTQVDLNVNEQDLDPPGPNQSIFVDQQISSSMDGSPVGGAINPSVPYITPSAIARARPGILRASVNAEANIPGVSYYSSSGSAQARWTARPVVKVDGVANGETGTIKGRMRFEGALGYENNGYGAGTNYVGSGSISLGLSVNGASGAASSAYTASYIDRITDNNVDRWFRITANRSGTPTYFPVDTRPPGTREVYRIGEYLDIEIGFQTGTPFDLIATLTAIGSASVGDSGRLNWYSDALNSAVWDGFQEVEINGVSYTEFTALDEFSGLDLVEASVVPLPAAVWLFLGPLTVVLSTIYPGRRGGKRA